MFANQQDDHYHPALHDNNSKTFVAALAVVARAAAAVIGFSGAADTRCARENSVPALM